MMYVVLAVVLLILALFGLGYSEICRMTAFVEYMELVNVEKYILDRDDCFDEFKKSSYFDYDFRSIIKRDIY